MLNIGEMNTLKVVRVGGPGYYLDGGDDEGEIIKSLIRVIVLDEGLERQRVEVEVR